MSINFDGKKFLSARRDLHALISGARRSARPRSSAINACAHAPAAPSVGDKHRRERAAISADTYIDISPLMQAYHRRAARRPRPARASSDKRARKCDRVYVKVVTPGEESPGVSSSRNRRLQPCKRRTLCRRRRFFGAGIGHVRNEFDALNYARNRTVAMFSRYLGDT